MKSTDAPVKHPIPFAANGSREAITATTPSGTNQASYDVGFPPITMTLKSAGGLPPKGQDMNQILFENDSFNRYFSAGGGYVYDSAFSASIGGYPLGARVPNSAGNGYWLNTVQDNTVNPENTTSALTGWVPDRSYGITAISGLVATSQVMTTLAASKDRITLAGALTANINIVVPAWIKSWTVVNNCTGSFSVTIKTASGTGVSIPTGMTAQVVGDGVNIIQDSFVIGLSGRLLNVQVITTSQTIIPPEGAESVDVEAIGGGASGASSADTTSGKTSLGSGGGSGTYGSGFYPVNFQSIVCTIGNGGLSSAVGANDGKPGGGTSFGSLLVCPGGKPGISHAPGSFPYFTVPAGQGNDATGWNVITVPGKQSDLTFTLDGSNIIPSPGADSFFGTGGLAYPTVGNGSGGRAFGSGGGAAISNNGSQGFQGGRGANGVIILRWYA